MVYFKPLNEQMANEIKERVQRTYVTLKDGRVLLTDKTPEEIFNRIKDNWHVMIDGEMHSRYSIVSATREIQDEVELLINSQRKDIRDKMRVKQKRLLKERDKEMSLEYAQNYLAKLLATDGTQ